jgi:uncharacterized protein
MKTIILLFISNLFMTFAWYWHLKVQNTPLVKIFFISWGLAFFEYMFMIPANRIGYQQFNAFQLKMIQEAITLIIFIGFALFYLKEPFKLNYIFGFFFLMLAVYFIFRK